MPMTEKFLVRVYGDVTQDTSNDIYSAWAKTYEAKAVSLNDHINSNTYTPEIS
ncbi:MAG: hypothetical protein P1U83_04780 [Roseovarius sp.]|nr:hypothetical protein [Roseovarius sp.]